MAASLAVLALFIVFCIGARHIYARRRDSHTSTAACPLINCTSENVDTDTTKQGSGPVVDEKVRPDANTKGASTMGPIKTELVRVADTHVNQRASPLAIDPQWNKSMDDSPLGLMSRPPPAPPLTPPELKSPTSQASPSSPSGARRRSYTRLIQGGLSITQASSPTEQEPADTPFLSTSYPPTTSLLPPAPPGLQEVEDEPRQTRQIEVQGEIISVLDGEGAGWTRHTRVYGGGVCLACAASGGNHGGGFYGANVSPEEMH
jgi:hypothetical protein